MQVISTPDRCLNMSDKGVMKRTFKLKTLPNLQLSVKLRRGYIKFH